MCENCYLILHSYELHKQHEPRKRVALSLQLYSERHVGMQEAADD